MATPDDDQRARDVTLPPRRRDVTRRDEPGERDLQQPHERDESSQADAQGPTEIGKQAADDLAAGRVDTGYRAARTDTLEPAHTPSPDPARSSNPSESR